MAAPHRSWAANLLYLWFHRLEPADWWSGSDETDALLRRRFAFYLEALGHRPPHEFLTGPRTALASVLLFDQVPRNLYSGTPRAFAFDPLARALTYETIGRGWHTGLSRVEQQFLGMPLMHSEAIFDQRNSLAWFTRLGPRFGLEFARDHYRVIARFGRFPHRNRVLGRDCTPAEKRAIEAGFAW